MSAIEFVPGHHGAPAILAHTRTLLDPDLRAAVDTLPATTRRIAGYHLGWWDECGRATTGGGGKAIRPALVFACAEAVGGDAERARPAAVAVELAHNAALLHDDIVDGDRVRRHRPAVWAAFGLGPAILAGDALLALAYDALAGSGLPTSAHELSNAVTTAQEGQAADLAFEKRGDVTLADGMRAAEQKTGALFGAAAALGARFGGAEEDRIAPLRSFGVRLGVAHQLVDDLLGIWGDPKVTGKPVYADLENRKKSLPVLAALAAGNAAGRALAALYHRRTSLSAVDLVRTADLVDRAGGLEWCRAHAEEVSATALADLAATDLPRSAELSALAHLVTCRDH